MADDRYPLTKKYRDMFQSLQSMTEITVREMDQKREATGKSYTQQDGTVHHLLKYAQRDINATVDGFDGEFSKYSHGAFEKVLSKPEIRKQMETIQKQVDEMQQRRK